MSLIICSYVIVSFLFGENGLLLRRYTWSRYSLLWWLAYAAGRHMGLPLPRHHTATIGSILDCLNRYPIAFYFRFILVVNLRIFKPNTKNKVIIRWFVIVEKAFFSVHFSLTTRFAKVFYKERKESIVKFHILPP